LQSIRLKGILSVTETVGESTVSSGSWGEDSYYALAGAVHFHVASPALNFDKIRAVSFDLRLLSFLHFCQ
jgi:hypothetical protein